MYQVGTYLTLATVVFVYIVESLDVGSNSLHLTLPHRLLGVYLGGREARQGEAKRKKVLRT